MSKKITVKIKNKELNALESFLTTEYKDKTQQNKDRNLSLQLWGNLIRAYDKDLKK